MLDYNFSILYLPLPLWSTTYLLPSATTLKTTPSLINLQITSTPSHKHPSTCISVMSDYITNRHVHWANDVMTTPQNCIEDFGPIDFPMRAPRDYTPEDIRHMMDLKGLLEVRYRIYRRTRRSRLVINDLERVLADYMQVADSALANIELCYDIDVKRIRAKFAAQKLAIREVHCCRFLFPYIKARIQATMTKQFRIQGADAVLKTRKDELHEARDLMHRQLIMNAFLTCPLSWNSDKYTIDGVRQGCLSNSDIHAYRLVQLHNGVYSLRLEWIRFRGATKYPASLLIKRHKIERFAIADVAWADYDGPSNELDLHPRFAPKTVQITATIWCPLVAQDQSRKRVETQGYQTATKKDKWLLPFWKLLTNKSGGDGFAAMAQDSPNEPVKLPNY